MLGKANFKIWLMIDLKVKTSAQMECALPTEQGLGCMTFTYPLCYRGLSNSLKERP